MYVPKYDYAKLDRQTAENGVRHYVTQDNISMPSVTTILAETGNKDGLQKWKDWVGEEEAAKQSRQAANLGSKVHNALEAYMHGEENYLTEGSNLINVLARSMTEKMIKEGLVDVNEVWGIEEHLYVEKVYAGTADCIGVFEGEEAIIDFKTAKKVKARSHIKDYFLQGCAYALAHNQMFGTSIQKVVILMVDRESKFKKYILEGDDFTEHCDEWASRVEEYYNNMVS